MENYTGSRMRLLLLVAATLAISGLYFYFRPPQGDQQPLSDDALRNILNRRGRRGDVPEEVEA